MTNDGAETDRTEAHRPFMVRYAIAASKRTNALTSTVTLIENETSDDK